MNMSFATAAEPGNDDRRRLTGWTVFLANASLVYFALSTFSGEQEASPYEHGLAYDKDIAAARVQDAKAWRVTVLVERQPMSRSALIDVVFRRADGQPIDGLNVEAALAFPTDKQFDRIVALGEANHGEYAAEAPLRDGQWDVTVTASRAGEPQFRSHNRVLLR
jgi:nitrogen fixation protein FixH